jgi:membrane fusion protein, multidrug efflux system
MKKINLTLLTLVLAAIFLVSCGAKKKELVVVEKPVAVTVAAAVRTNIAISKTYTGTLEGFKQAKIYSSIPEAVVGLPVSEGSLVDAGQPVVLLDKDGPTSHFKQAEAMYLDAKDNYEKMGNLFKQGAISEQTYNGVKTNFEVARANYTAAKQQVELTSPISGVLTDLSVNIGQYAPVGEPLATVAQTDKMRLTIYIDGRGASYIKNGQKAKVTIDAASISSSDFEGTVTEVAKSADPDTRLFRVEIQINNSERLLSPGMYARAAITISELNNVLTVPKESVFMIEGISKVYTLSNDNRAKERTVTVGEWTAESYQITLGLSEGENVIVLGRNQVEDGTLVKVMENSESTQPTDSLKES